MKIVILILIALVLSGCSVNNDLPSDIDWSLKEYIENPELPSEYSQVEFTDVEDPEVQTLQSQAFSTKGDIYLTFDDFGSLETLKMITGVLDKYNAKATFFVNCRYIDPTSSVYRADGLESMRLLQSKGHTIGNHSYSHFSIGVDVYNNTRSNPDKRSDGSIVPPPTSAAQGYTYQYGYEKGLDLITQEITSCDNLFNRNGLWSWDKIWRSPYGEYFPVVMTALTKAGYTQNNTYGFSHDTCDFVASTTTQEIIDSVLLGKLPSFCAEGNNINVGTIKHNGIVLLHWDFDIINTKRNVAALDVILSNLQSKFYFKALQDK